MSRKQKNVIRLLLGITACLFWGTGLSFTFWKDDWSYLWNALYRPQDLFAISSLHPGTTAEFLFFGSLFGADPLPWQYAGILFRVFAAIGVMDMATVLSASPLTGVLSGFLFVMLPQGMESVLWASAHVTNIAVFLYAEGVASYLGRSAPGKRTRYVPYLLWGAAFAADPVRILPLAWVPFLFGRFTRQSFSALINTLSVRIFLIAGSVLGIVSVLPFLRIWIIDRWQLVMAHPLRIGIFGNLGQSIWILVTGHFVPAGHTLIEISHGVLEPKAGLTGMLVILSMIAYLHANRRVWSPKTNLFMRVAALWMVVTLGVQWLAEPRLVPAVAHRYYVIPGVGLVMFVAGALRRLPVRVMIVALVAIAAASWMTSRDILRQMNIFRNVRVVERIWQTIDDTVTTRDVPPVIVIMGQDPMKSNTVDFGAKGHFMLLRAGGSPIPTAIFTTDSDEIVRIVCSAGSGRKYRIGDIYAFSVLSDGSARDDSPSFRDRWLMHADVSECLGLLPPDEVK